jgi:glycosyltransferase involved in cell wall biosynthesis
MIAAGAGPARGLVVYVINNAAFFVSHRLALALAARESGWDIRLVVGQAASPSLEATAIAELARHNVAVSRLAFRSDFSRPIAEIMGFVQLLWTLARLRPSIVHVASPKGVLYGGTAARIVRSSALVVAISGMGYLFTGQAHGLKRLMRASYSWLLARVMRHPRGWCIVQNEDDLTAMLPLVEKAGNPITLIPGSGVDVVHYSQVAKNPAGSVVLLPARLVRDKGIVEFVDAARLLRDAHPGWRFVLAGTADNANPSAISPKVVEQWVVEGVVEWWGHVSDMRSAYEEAAVICLPSYREGMPKALLEAAACARPVVTTDVPGCREAIIDGQTGLLAAARNGEALANALSILIDDAELRHRYGQAGLELAKQRFSLSSVVETTLEIYAKIHGNREIQRLTALTEKAGL